MFGLNAICLLAILRCTSISFRSPCKFCNSRSDSAAQCLPEAKTLHKACPCVAPTMLRRSTSVVAVGDEAPSVAASARFTACPGRSGTNYRQAREIIAFAAPNSLWDKENTSLAQALRHLTTPRTAVLQASGAKDIETA